MQLCSLINDNFCYYNRNLYFFFLYKNMKLGCGPTTCNILSHNGSSLNLLVLSLYIFVLRKGDNDGMNS